MRKHMRTGVVGLVVLLLTALVGCSQIKISTWKADGATPQLRRIALMPLIVVGATRTKVSMSWSPGWIIETKVAMPLAPGEYKPAESAFGASVRAAFPTAQLVMPSEVEEAVGSAEFATVKEAIAGVAQLTAAEGVVLLRVRDFDTQPAGLENARAKGHADLTYYDARAEPLWSISAEALKSGVGLHGGAPTLPDFVSYVMEQFEPKIERLSR